MRTVAGWLILGALAAARIAAGPAGNVAGSVKDLDFLTGRWSGTTEGFQTDEIWSSATNGSLMGVYREMKDSKTTFFEFMTIEQELKGPVLRLRHFKPGMIALDNEPTVFLLAVLSPDKAVFEGGNKVRPIRMTFEKKSDNKMEILLEHKRDNGEWTHEVFAYTRHKN